MRAEDQERILVELRSRVVDEACHLQEKGRQRLDELIADTIYYETRRLKDERDAKVRRQELAFYDEVRRAMLNASEKSLARQVDRIVDRYSREIAGNFDERVYKTVTTAALPALGLLMNAVSPRMIVSRFPDLPRFDDAMIIQGEIEHIRRLHELGTVILVPTHASNMDSIVIGYALFRLGLPPFIYGAGLNLFENPLLGFFMHNLGAYTVDRRKKDTLYKNVLKEYATLTLEHGYDNIFFPGGTRSRSGAIETKLKLGLLGTGVRAYTNNLLKGRKNPRVFIVPATLSYQLCLEAETLIDDFLKEVGKSRYIITDDEFSKPTRIFDFMKQVIGLDSKIYVTFSRGFDPFGNPVDDDGQSIDPRGRIVDPADYVKHNGVPHLDDQRDAEFTNEVGVRVVESFLRDNLIQATNVTARAVFSLFRQKNRGIDLIRLLRAGGLHDDMAMAEVLTETERLLRELRGLEGRGGIRLGPIVKHGLADEVVADGLRHFAIYHKTPACTRRGDRVFATDRSLLFYYQNRLEGYRLEREVDLSPALTRDHRAIEGRA